VTWTGTFVDRVVSVEPFHVSGSVASVGLAHVVDNIVIHVFVLVDVSVVGGVSVGEFVRVFSHGVCLEFSELDERLVKVFLVLGEVLDVLPPMAWGDVEVTSLNLKLEEGVVEWLGVVERLVSLVVVFLWVGHKMTSADGVDVVHRSEDTGALGSVDASAVWIICFLKVIVVLNLNHVSFSLVTLVVLLGEAVSAGTLWVSNSIWVGDPSVVIVVNSVNVIHLEWAFGPSSAVVLLTHLGLPLIRAFLKFFLFLWILWLLFLWFLLFCWVELSEGWLFGGRCPVVSVGIVNVVKLHWALRLANTIVLHALFGHPVFLWTLVLSFDHSLSMSLSWVVNLSQMMSLCFLVVVLRFKHMMGFMHIIGFCLHGKEVAWTNNVINVVVSVVILHVSGSVSSVGGAVVINDIIVHILILMDISVISGITVGKLIRVSTKLNEVSSSSEVLLLVFHAVIEVLIDNIISWVTLVFEILILVVVSVGDVIASSDATLGVLGDILGKVILVNFDGVIQIAIIQNSDG